MGTAILGVCIMGGTGLTRPAVAQEGPQPYVGDAAGFSATFFFGDALTDAGFYRPLLPASVRPLTGQYTTNSGYSWAQYFAAHYGTGAGPNGNAQTGTNYALGNATIDQPVNWAFGPAPSISEQVATYLASTSGVADPRALYTLQAGVAGLYDPFSLGTVITPSAAGAAMSGLATGLSDAGARYVLVMGPTDLGLTPSANAAGGAVVSELSTLSEDYSVALFAAIGASGTRVIPIDMLTFSRELQAEALAFGFTNVTGTACQPQITANSLTCNVTSVVNPDARNTYLYADGIHYTTRAHDIISQYVVSVLEAPRLIAQLPQSLAANGAARAERVFARTSPLATNKPGWWIDARGGLSDLGGDSGFGADVLAGYDFEAGDARIGLFAGLGENGYDFASGGGYDQTELSLGAYAAWSGPSGWFQTQASYTAGSFDVDRLVTLAGRVTTASLNPSRPITDFSQLLDVDPFVTFTGETLGGVTRSHAGETEGEVLSFGASGGWTFDTGRVKHGPIAGVLAQIITVDGYSESNPDLSTAMGYRDQSFDSVIGSIGWQAIWDARGSLAPYAKVILQHEAGTGAEEAFARSLTLADTDFFAVPGIEIDRNFVTATLGMQGDLMGMNTNFGATATVGRGDGIDIVAFLGLSQSF